MSNTTSKQAAPKAQAKPALVDPEVVFDVPQKPIPRAVEKAAQLVVEIAREQLKPKLTYTAESQKYAPRKPIPDGGGADASVIEAALKSKSPALRQAATELSRVTYTAESQKWGHLVAPYMKGNGIELATGGAPIVPTSIQFELSERSYAKYNSNQPLRGPVHWRSDDAIFDLPFRDGMLDYAASSHLLEDFEPAVQLQLLTEWVRVLKKGGKLIVCVPDKKRWDAAVAAGQCPNCAHRHEMRVGELSALAPQLGLAIIMDKFTEVPVGDYNIAFVCQKL